MGRVWFHPAMESKRANLQPYSSAGERPLYTGRVGGSIPSAATTSKSYPRLPRCLLFLLRSETAGVDGESAGVTQLAEWQPSKLHVAGSNPVSRSIQIERDKSGTPGL
jgi:hypothetical protein